MHVFGENQKETENNDVQRVSRLKNIDLLLRLNLCFLCVIIQDLSQCVTCKEKHITVKKEPLESLGMTVAGGRGSKSGELPIFVTSVQPHGCLSRDGRIKRGKPFLRNDNNGTDSARSKTLQHLFTLSFPQVMSC